MQCLLVVVSFKRCHLGASAMLTVYNQSFLEILEGRNYWSWKTLKDYCRKIKKLLLANRNINTCRDQAAIIHYRLISDIFCTPNHNLANVSFMVCFTGIHILLFVLWENCFLLMLQISAKSKKLLCFQYSSHRNCNTMQLIWKLVICNNGKWEKR